MSRTVKCNRCHAWRLPSDFISNDRNMKCCSKCREVANANNKKYREDHAEQIKKYRDDNAEQIKKYREDHTDQMKKYYVDQKISNPLHVKFNRMIHCSIQSDTKYNRLYDPQDYINEEFLNYVWNDQDQRCYHCKCEMTLDFSATTRVPSQISIQRLNNDLPHIKSNCVLSCFSCNVNHKELTKVEHQ